MSGMIFWHTLRYQWRQALSWGAGLASIAGMLMIAIQDTDTIAQYGDLIQTMPKEITGLVGAINPATIGTPDGFIAFGFFAYGLIIMAVYAVSAGLNITANEEDEGILDILLSHPVPRWRVVLERFAAFTFITAGVLAVAFLGIFIGSQVSALDFRLNRLFAGIVNMLPGTLFIVAMTALLAVLLRRKGIAAGVAGAIVTASYFINFIAELADNALIDALKRFSVFTYYNSADVIENGLAWGNIALLLGMTGIFMAGTIWAFNRRDIGL